MPFAPVYYRTVTFGSTMVSGGSNLSNFVFETAGTLASFKDTTTDPVNGRLRVDGLDLAVYSDAALTTLVAFDRVILDTTTGRYKLVWKGTALTGAITVFYIAYGDAAQATDLSSPTTAYDTTQISEVWHGGNLVGRITGDTLTAVGSPTTVTGLLGDAWSFNGSTQYLKWDTALGIAVPTMAIEALFKCNSLAAASAIACFSKSDAGGTCIVELTSQTSGAMRGTVIGTGVNNNATTGTGLLGTTNWHNAVVTVTAVNADEIRLDGATAVATGSTSVTSFSTPNAVTIGARRTGGNINTFANASVEEVIFYKVNPGTNWKITRDNVTRLNATYVTTGAETPVASNNAPTASITAPTTGSSVAAGASVTFTGSGTDTEDGALTGASLVWASDLDGQIGTGTTFATTALSGGIHTITLTATDSANATGTATITLTITTTGQAEVLALIAATGGNANWNAAYEPSFNATMLSGAVSQLADVRGTGFGKTLAQSTAGARPTRATDASGRTVARCASASTQHLVAATVDTAIDLSLATPTYVISIARTSSTGGPAFGVAADPTSTATYPYAVVQTQSGNVGAAGAPTSAAVLAPNTGLGAADGVARLAVWGKARTHVTTGVGTSAPGNPHWRLHGTGRMAQEFDSTSGASVLPTATAGGLKPVLGRLGSSYFDGDVLFAGVFIGDLSAAYLETLRQFAEARGAVLDASQRAAPIWMGNSLTVGHNASDRYTYVAGSGTSSPAYGTITAVTTLPAWTSRFDIPADLLRTNLFGVAGQNLSDIDQAFPLRFAPLRDARRPGRQWYELWEITNQIVSIGSSASAILALIASIRTQVLAAGGAGLIVGTTIDRGNYYTSGVGTGGLNTFGTIAQSVNTSLRAGAGTYQDGLIDYEADSQFTIGTGACASTTIYRAASADFTHLTDPGYAAIAAIRRAFYDANNAALFPSLSSASRRHRRAAAALGEY